MATTPAAAAPAPNATNEPSTSGGTAGGTGQPPSAIDQVAANLRLATEKLDAAVERSEKLEKAQALLNKQIALIASFKLSRPQDRAGPATVGPRLLRSTSQPRAVAAARWAAAGANDQSDRIIALANLIEQLEDTKELERSAKAHGLRYYGPGPSWHRGSSGDSAGRQSRTNVINTSVSLPYVPTSPLAVGPPTTNCQHVTPRVEDGIDQALIATGRTIHRHKGRLWSCATLLDGGADSIHLHPDISTLDEGASAATVGAPSAVGFSGQPTRAGPRAYTHIVLSGFMIRIDGRRYTEENKKDYSILSNMSILRMGADADKLRRKLASQPRWTPLIEMNEWSLISCRNQVNDGQSDIQIWYLDEDNKPKPGYTATHIPSAYQGGWQRGDHPGSVSALPAPMHGPALPDPVHIPAPAPRMRLCPKDRAIVAEQQAIANSYQAARGDAKDYEDIEYEF